MPQYSYECACGKQYTEVLSVADYQKPTKCPECGKNGKKIIQFSQTEPTFTDKLYSSGQGYYDVGLGQVFHSKKQKETWMKQNGYVSKDNGRHMTKKQERFVMGYRMSNRPKI